MELKESLTGYQLDEWDGEFCKGRFCYEAAYFLQDKALVSKIPTFI